MKDYVSRGTITEFSPSGSYQSYQVTTLREGSSSGVEHYQNFGFKSFPKKGAEALVLYPYGIWSNAVITSISDRRVNIELEEGQVCTYSHPENRLLFDNENTSKLQTGESSIHLNKNGNIQIKSGDNELISIIREIWQVLKNTKVPTIYGPQNLPEVVAGFDVIDSKLKKYTG